MSEAKHSPLPWRMVDHTPMQNGIYDADDKYVALVDGDAYDEPDDVDNLAADLAEANAELIVRAVNAHDALVKALETYLAWEEAEGRADRNHAACVMMLTMANDMAKAALALAAPKEMQ